MRSIFVTREILFAHSIGQCGQSSRVSRFFSFGRGDCDGQGQNSLSITHEQLFISIEKMGSLAFQIRVAVGSTNPCKLEAVRLALERMVHAVRPEEVVEIQLHGFSVPSGVSDQPVGDTETRDGARNRATAAFQQYLEEKGEEPHFSVGLEGGIRIEEGCSRKDEDTYFCMAWMCVMGRRTEEVLKRCCSIESCASVVRDLSNDIYCSEVPTAAFALPPAVQHKMKEGMELGEADDLVFGRQNGGQSSGTVGLLTCHLIDRSKYYEHAIILALIPWMKPHLYI